MANTSGPEATDFVRRPLYVYDLPAELISTLTYSGSTSVTAPAASEEEQEESVSRQQSEDGAATSTSCSLCNAKFSNVTDQREHVRSDFHRYNLKMKLKGLGTMDESTFTKAVGELDESITGSDTESSEDDDSDSKPGDSTLTALLRKQAKISETQESEAIDSLKPRRGAGNPPLYWMASPKLPQDTVVGVYRALLSNQEQKEADLHLVETIKSKQLKPLPAKSSGNAAAASNSTSIPHMFLCMVGGGHFAAMVVALAPEVSKKAGGTEERNARVLAHKTFHRYTTRRKQGGSQSAKDNSGKSIHSAGSSLRRYNEAALENDIRSILSEWKSLIDTSELLFIRATGTTSRRTLYGPYDGQVLRNNDPRIRGFPFTTRRATQSELMRAFTGLTRLKVSTISETTPKETASKSTAATSTTSKQPSTPKPTTPALSPEEEALALHTTQVTALIRRSKAPALLSYLTNNSLSPSFTFYPANHHTPTALHLAASLSSPALVLALLTKPTPLGTADPTITNTNNNTPYDLAGDLKTRLAFRTARHTLGEPRWPWPQTHIPSPLTQPEADTLLNKTQSSEKAAEAERRRLDLESIRREEDERKLLTTEKKAGKGKTLAGAMINSTTEKSAQDRREEEMRGLSAEMKMRLERERRARAAEERIKRLQQQQQ